nr:PHB depolymerase family esterase [Paracoccus saliphilus]
MTKPTELNMAEITRLMRAGQLSEATQMIQTRLGGAPVDLASAAPLRGMSGKGLPSGLGLPLGLGMSRDAGEPAAAALGSWSWREHQAAGQSRQYRLYVPASLVEGETPAGILLLLHGCTQDPDDFARGTRIHDAAERHRMVIIAPAQPAQSNMNRCWNWFEPRHTAAEGGEAAFLTDLTRAIGHEFAVPPDLRFAAGLSAGGAMAVILGAVFPDDFGAVACHSGLPNGAARDMGSAFAAMSGGGSDRGKGAGCRLFVLHGAADRTVSPQNAQAVVAQALRAQPGLTRSAAAARLDDHNVQVARFRDKNEVLRIESWTVEGLGHAWSGGAPQGSHTAAGPSATTAMMRFFLTPARKR